MFQYVDCFLDPGHVVKAQQLYGSFEQGEKVALAWRFVGGSISQFWIYTAMAMGCYFSVVGVADIESAFVCSYLAGIYRA